MRFPKFAIGLVVSACISLSVHADPQNLFAHARPVFDPMKFYAGHTESWGVFENRHGEPTETIRTETWGKIVNGELRMEQDLYLGDKPRQHRSWRMRRVDADHFIGTANDIVGTAKGQSAGNLFLVELHAGAEAGKSHFRRAYDAADVPSAGWGHDG